MRAGDVIYADFAGAQGFKRRPCVVISTEYYHDERADVLLTVIPANCARRFLR